MKYYSQESVSTKTDISYNGPLYSYTLYTVHYTLYNLQQL